MPINPAEPDFRHYHQQELPQRLAREGNALAGAAAASLPPLAIQLSDCGEAYTYFPDAGGIKVLSGSEEAHTIIELERELWRGLATDLETVPGLLYGERLGEGSHGDMAIFSRWEPVLRSMYHGLPIYDPAHWELRDSHGGELNPHHNFALDDDTEQMREFLDSAGYLLVDSVFDQAELEVFRQQAQELRDEAREGDKTSWWGKNTPTRDNFLIEWVSKHQAFREATC